MRVETPVYLDNHSTTPIDPRVLEEMERYMRADFGNSASRNHAFGWVAEEAVERAREQIATLIGATAKEIVFTSGATESDNIAIKGAVEMYAEKGNHVITCTTEHKAVLDTCKYLEQQGRAEVTYLEPDEFGRVSVESVEAAITDKTVLIAIMAANNEIGTIAPLAELGQLAKEKGILFFTDAAQAVGRIPLDVQELGIDIMAISGHKVYGPKGIGALYVRRRRPRVRLSPLLHGGGHERGMRSGTLPVFLCAGLGKACELAGESLANGEVEKTRAQRDRLHEGIASQLGHLKLNGHPEHRLPNNLNLSFAFVEGEGLMMAMKDLAVSSGSACTSASLEPSYVLRAIGVGDDMAHSSIRFGLGRFSKDEEVDFAIEQVVQAVTKLREMSPLYEMAMEGVDLSQVQWQAPEGH